jgi:8-oxo-dGTP pyrophosphatase MutT (NUDIX family)
MKRDLCVTTYIVDNEKVLLLFHKKLQKWLPPGGHIDPNETPQEAAVREAKEETGLDIELISFQKELNFDYFNANVLACPFACLRENIPAYKEEPAHEHIDFPFLAKPVSFNLLKNDRETEGLKWFTLEEVIKLTADEEIFRETQDVVRFVFTHLYASV